MRHVLNKAFSFSSLQFPLLICLLLMKKEQNKMKKKKFHLGLGESIQQIGKRFLKLFFLTCVLASEAKLGSSCMPRKASEIRGAQGCAKPGKSNSERCMHATSIRTG